ncbi:MULTISPECIES: CPBP family intramembrane glutamic endopeptidase [Croceitalea]|uniref:CPBP family intramembrane glutamic endopeptidase n=1 Tax=Croceitalea vernalis TaxID=3075599 RepID=A0ABU3BGP3_9FLAO|nr:MULTISPECIES: CPBP family intramembrane glutamic endopeptidase [unclassified Croceitalea]MDT0539539.1 CPBP family intramembrane glutamic endopeptidase [Croceitalea sp. P059]MDT0621331.1 CPBP family intramembrane glutamic endopeptidase [Croceitalea sp. P007]
MYIEQGYKQRIGIWSFFVIPLLFLGLTAVSLVLLNLLALDTDAIIASEIEKKGSNRFLAESLLQFAVMLAVLIFWVLVVQKQSFTAFTTSRARIDWKRVFFVFALWGLITIGFTLLDVYLSPDDYVINFNLAKFLPLAVIAILLVPLQTSFEEYLFRGHMMQGLGILAKNRWVPLVVTSVLFGLMHIANPEVEKLGYGIMVYYIGTGFFLGIMTLMDEGLELALGFHAANNLITALLVTADWTAFQTNSVFKDISEPGLSYDVLIPVFVIFPILLYILGRKYNWTNWKEKLTGRVMTKEQFVALQDDASSTVQA